jgi:hypothetical protein
VTQVMFDSVFDTLRNATESTQQMQQEIVRQRINPWSTATPAQELQGF